MTVESYFTMHSNPTNQKVFPIPPSSPLTILHPPPTANVLAASSTPTPPSSRSAMLLLRPSSRIPSLFRPFSSSASAMAAQPRFSAGTDAASLTPALTPLLVSEGGRWALTNEGTALERRFRFKTFAKTWVCSVPLALLVLRLGPAALVKMRLYAWHSYRRTDEIYTGLHDRRLFTVQDQEPSS